MTIFAVHLWEIAIDLVCTISRTTAPNGFSVNTSSTHYIRHDSIDLDDTKRNIERFNYTSDFLKSFQTHPPGTNSTQTDFGLSTDLCRH